MNSFVTVLKKLQMSKKPKIYNIYKKHNKLVVIDKLSFTAKRDLD